MENIYSHTRGHTSSAFSASAHGPHEDWTKISDLAERRRIQNRIAQRNYRKKLKKRLEDLEKRANTSTDESDHKATTSKHKSTKSKDSAVSKAPISPVTASRSPSDFPLQNSEPPQIGFLPYPDDRLFSEQYGARMSASPPPPAPLNIASSDMLYSTYSSNSSYSSVSAGCDPSLYAYQTPFDSPYPSPLPDMQFPKQDLFSEPDTLSVALGFAPMPHMDFQQLPQVNYPFSLPPYAQ